MKNFLIGLATVVVALLLVVGSFSAGFVAGRTAELPGWVAVSLHSLFQNVGALDGPLASELGLESPVEPRALFAPFWESWELVKDFYVDQPVNEEQMMRGAIQGMLESLGDEHTSYLDPAMFEATSAHLEGQEYEGIGAWVDITGDYLVIISPMPDSPAEKAGLKPGDKVIAIDGEDMTGIDGEAVRQRVLGPDGSTVILTILREGVEKPLDVSVVRGSIVVPSVNGEMLDNGIAHIELFTFGDKTAEDLRETLQTLLDQKPKGLILDLRNNGGGYLETAIDVCSEFIDKGVVMYEVYGDGRQEVFNSKGGGIATDIPLVVLVNEGSASASEIVAGAIQDLGRGYLVGVTTYGKGSVQTVSTLSNDQGAVRVTVARWLTPNRRQIAKIGLAPDFEIDFTEQDIAAGTDVQLERAVEVLLKGLTPPPTPVPSQTPAPTTTPQ